MAAAVEPLPAIGRRVKALREAMDLSLRDLALRSGVSAPWLSQVERGETSPTLQVAARIAAGLQLRLSQLLRLDEQGSVDIVRPAERRMGGAGGHRYEVLTPPLPGQRAEVSRHTLAPGAATGGPGDPPMHEPGARETALAELGLTQPGMTIVCGDSHTATHGAFGALAFGIGTSEVEHVLATQTLAQPKPRSMRIRYEGSLAPGVTAKDLILGTIGRMGTGGAAGHVVEYAGPAIEALTMEGRMTVCNMTIEGGGRAGMIAPDDTTFAWIEEQQR